MRFARWLLRLVRGLTGHSTGSIDPPASARRARWTRPRITLTEWRSDDPPASLRWKACHPRTVAIFKADMTCERGHAVSLRAHRISSDGTVHPSVVCLVPGCDFHDFVKLEGWSAGAI